MPPCACVRAVYVVSAQFHKHVAEKLSLLPAVRALYTGTPSLPPSCPRPRSTNEWSHWSKDLKCVRAVEGRKIGSLEEIEDKQVLVAVKTGTTFTKDRRTCTCFVGHSVRKKLVTGWVGGCVPHLCVGAGGGRCSAAGHPATSACRVIGVRKAAYSRARNATPL